MASDIEKVIADFEAKLKQVTPEEVTPEGIQPAVEEPVAEPAAEGEEYACISSGFKELVAVLPAHYASPNIKDLLIEFIKDLPECEV